MALKPGTRVGLYEVVAQLGVGGMGEVYRATDTSLGRQVAIKVLPEAFAEDADRLARFEREARTLASLNHPNIAIIHGLERTGAVHALVMELVEGPTLADRIAEGPLALDEALAIANQIAEALEAAHEQGIVHRDLKPANVKVRPDGTVKVLDFGLAKAVEPRGSATSGLAQSPTITSPVMTAAGVLLGTASYMSPEQARGRAVDKRTDIWAFGAVLYEMLTGHRAFPGDDVPEVLASVLAREPDWTQLPATLPPSITTVIRRCLQRDRKQRLRDIGDVSLALAGTFSADAPRPASVRAESRPLWRRFGPVAATAALAVLATSMIAWRAWPSPEVRSPTRFEYLLPAGQEFAMTQRPVIAAAGAGGGFVYQARDGLYLRSLSELEPHRIHEALDGANPFFSPDGQWVGYFSAAGHLNKISVSGGAPVALAPTTAPLGASWASDGTILFGQRAGIMRVSANGGTPELIVPAAENEELYGPQLMPDGRSVLFSVTTARGPNRWDEGRIVVQSLSSGTRSLVVNGGTAPRYLSSGHVVYTVRDALFGIPFDARRMAATGGPRPLVEGIQQPVGVSAEPSNYSVSNDGTLVFVSRVLPQRTLVWRRRGATTDEPIVAIPPGGYEDPRLSPDGSRVLVTSGGDIWIYDLASGRSSRVTRDGVSLMGVWEPSGARIAYSSAAGGNLEAWVAPVDGSGSPRQVTTLGGQIHVDSWSPDGRMLTVHRHAPVGPGSILTVSMEDAGREPQVFVEGKPSAEGADFSTDMRYASYLSIETGQREIYIRPYPGPGGQATVSVGGGREPIWSPNGEVFYRSPAGDRMFAVSAATAPALKVGPPLLLFEAPYYISPTNSPRPQYDVTPDGQRFLLISSGRGPDAGAARPKIVVVANWLEELKRLLPAD